MPQTSRRPSLPWSETRDRLLRFQDVVAMRAHAGEVLVYSGHQPPGLFLFTDARLEIVRPGERAPRPLADTERGPFLLPSLADLDRPAPGTVSLAADAELIFVPRSLAASSRELKDLLEGAELPACGWGEPG